MFGATQDRIGVIFGREDCDYRNSIVRWIGGVQRLEQYGGNAVSPRGHRGGEDHHDGVHLAAIDEHFNAAPVLLRRCRGDEVDGVGHACPGSEEAQKTLLQLGAQLWDLQPLGGTRVGGQYTGSTGIGNDGHAMPHGQGLVGEDLGHIEELFDGVHPNHPGLVAQGLNGPIRARHGGGVGGRGSSPGTRSTRLHRHDGLCPTHPLSDAAELRGFPKDSRYRRIDVGRVVCPHHVRRSFPLTSPLLPIETKVESPMSR